MDTYVVNFIGGPGCGKTTIAATIFSRLKILGHVAEYVQEFAKQLVWTGEFDLLNNQYYVTNHQTKMLSQMNGKVEYIITDGPLVHGLFYNLHNPDNTSNIDKTNRLILSNISKFKNINIFLNRGEYKYETSGRNQTEAESKDVDVIIKYLLKSNNIDYQEFASDTSDTNISSIIHYVIEKTKLKTT